jgi:hypothetical protein
VWGHREGRGAGLGSCDGGRERATGARAGAGSVGGVDADLRVLIE